MSGRLWRFPCCCGVNDYSTLSVLDLTLTDVDLKGFTDDRYGYFVPYDNGVYFGKVAPVDLNEFSTVTVLDLTQTDVDLKGYQERFISDGYGYFIPTITEHIMAKWLE